MENLQWTVLWTDFFVYCLVGVGVLALYRLRTNPNSRNQISKLLRRPLPLVSVMVLLVYIIIGFMDSIHFDSKGQSAGVNQVQSLLDFSLAPLGQRYEVSFSSPFAIRGYSKETKFQDGEMQGVYPRLKYAGAHLSSEENHSHDIIKRLIQAWLKATIVFCTIAAFLSARASRRAKLDWEDYAVQALKGQCAFPWRSFLLCGYCLLIMLAVFAECKDFYHILGTSKVGEDVLYQSLKSIRTGLVIGSLTTLVMLPMALTLGTMAGYFRGKIDDCIQYIYTTLSSIPSVLLIAAAVLTLDVLMARYSGYFQSQELRSDLRLLALCVILGLSSWTGLCRLLRAEALKLREIDYVQAAKAFGVSHFSIIRRHLLPNMMHIILISIALDFSGLVLAEAVLSYIGVGVDPSTYSWGTMINGARLEMAREPIVWWSLFSAFWFMFVLVLAANIFADALRDAFDPRTQVS